ncbi:hypothetical protein NR798_44650 [Archangium gephyra]|uniref:hypothetical protein n=1 Tax=Archangium gephyra TaxID=48 RepID=UPI0035D45695
MSGLVSCRAATGSHVPEPAPPQAACPSQDFGTFLTAFANDASVQEAFTVRPLRIDSIDAAAEPEPKRVTRRVDGAELRFPLLPSLQRQQQDGLTMRWAPDGDDKAEVFLSKPDTDYQTSFFFIRKGCWLLEWIQDDSL